MFLTFLPILHWRPAAHLENLPQTALQRVGLAGDSRQKLFSLVLRHALAGSQLRSGPRLAVLLLSGLALSLTHHLTLILRLAILTLLLVALLAVLRLALLILLAPVALRWVLLVLILLILLTLAILLLLILLLLILLLLILLLLILALLILLLLILACLLYTSRCV